MFKSQTHDISVTVTPTYQPSQSVPRESYYVWSYHVSIRNNGNKIVQLINRYWKIIDAGGHANEVYGQGVIGMQPQLFPGEVFEYTSNTNLETEYGIMMGSYGMVDKDGEMFDVEIPAFSLSGPQKKYAVN